MLAARVLVVVRQVRRMLDDDARGWRRPASDGATPGVTVTLPTARRSPSPDGTPVTTPRVVRSTTPNGSVRDDARRSCDDAGDDAVGRSPPGLRRCAGARARLPHASRPEPVRRMRGRRAGVDAACRASRRSAATTRSSPRYAPSFARPVVAAWHGANDGVRRPPGDRRARSSAPRAVCNGATVQPQVGVPQPRRVAPRGRRRGRARSRATSSIADRHRRLSTRACGDGVALLDRPRHRRRSRRARLRTAGRRQLADDADAT